MNRIEVRLIAPTNLIIDEVQKLFQVGNAMRTHVFFRAEIGEQPSIDVAFFPEDLTKIVNPDIWAERAQIQEDARAIADRLHSKAVVMLTATSRVPVEAVSGKQHPAVDITGWGLPQLWEWIAQQTEGEKCDVIIRIKDGQPTFLLYDDWME